MSIRWKPGHDTDRDFSTTPATKVPKPTYDGLVIGTETDYSVRIMSDVWADCYFAVVWNPETREVNRVGIGSSEFGSEIESITVDAPADILDLAEALEGVKALRRLKSDDESSIDRYIASADRIAKGKDVTVVRGRKVPKGSTGRVFWFDPNGRFGPRAGLELTSGERVFTAASNLEVTNPDDYIDLDAMMAIRTRDRAPDAMKAAAEWRSKVTSAGGSRRAA